MSKVKYIKTQKDFVCRGLIHQAHRLFCSDWFIFRDLFCLYGFDLSFLDGVIDVRHYTKCNFFHIFFVYIYREVESRE